VVCGRRSDGRTHDAPLTCRLNKASRKVLLPTHAGKVELLRWSRVNDEGGEGSLKCVPPRPGGVGAEEVELGEEGMRCCSLASDTLQEPERSSVVRSVRPRSSHSPTFVTSKQLKRRELARCKRGSRSTTS